MHVVRYLEQDISLK